ncbi:hypothetical protein SLEP1_g42311 [Rubroshorea leprosula]|uniref:Enoyl reductase (ER) domain-containing protein n=1 Tax=Rubroshorea leprosula TaxID=152421 RepID=A0AAV5LA26_9ROSI|nr:hypothetical protein SLEP1_g42311 [Rubroshorea leprosula]GKV33863.1 hypothetical protein SLEP1_g42311 [Rubroshorea leprosula]
MVKAIRVHELGGPEVLKWEDVEIGEPKEGEIRVRNKVIGLNFIDVYFRKGVYKAAVIPFTPVCIFHCKAIASMVGLFEVNPTFRLLHFTCKDSRRLTLPLQYLSQRRNIRFSLSSSSTLKSSRELVLVRAVNTEATATQASKMVKAIRVHELGGPEVLKWEDVEIGEPKEGEIRVRNKAIGLNFIDVYFRKGVYKVAVIPFTPGMEAVGEVIAVGPGLTGRKVGDIVAYAGQPMGSYAEEQILPADKVVPVPPSVDPIIAASIMLKGMTAQFLVRRCFKVEPGHNVLVHAAAGGVGSLLCQWANALGEEAVGEVIAVGPGLTGRKVGDIVAYAGQPMGSYAEEQILPADRVVPVPPSVDPLIAASIMLKGMTAQYLVRRCFKVEPGHNVLVHAAAGGVGSLLCQWANALGATVIGTVSTKEKAAQAKEDGCHHVILYKEEDFVARVNEITSGKGVDVVYDSVGKDTFQVTDATLFTLPFA